MTRAAGAISIVVPTLDEASCLENTLRALAALAGDKEIIVADGGSLDSTVDIARRCGAQVVQAPRGRGSQMHAGATASRGDVLWFVHADTLAPRQAIGEIERALRDPATGGGNFTVRFDGPSAAARNLTWIYPRLRWLGLTYGDATLFIRRELYDALGGFRAYPIFEDLDLVSRLKRRARFVHLDCTVVASSRRFENRYGRAWVRWIALQLLYWAGVSPLRLGAFYREPR